MNGDEYLTELKCELTRAKHHIRHIEQEIAQKEESLNQYLRTGFTDASEHIKSRIEECKNDLHDKQAAVCILERQINDYQAWSE